MARIGPTAERQIGELASSYHEKDRIEAIIHLRDAVAAALAAIDDPGTRPGKHPSPYPALARYGMLWLKFHIYWFGYGRAADGEMTIANVLWDRGDIPARIEEFGSGHPGAPARD